MGFRVALDFSASGPRKEFSFGDYRLLPRLFFTWPNYPLSVKAEEGYF